MSALSIQVPFPVFQDRDGQPLENGYVWIGEPNLNPQTNPVVAYFDAALTIPAAQPLRTLNGYIYRGGSPAQIYVDGVNFSILVQDSKGSLVYSFADGTGIGPNAAGIVYDPAGTNAVPTTVQDKLREIPSILDFATQADVEASGLNWFFMPSGESLDVSGQLTKNFWGTGKVALSTGEVPGTQGAANYGFLALESVSPGTGQYFAFASKVFTGTRTDQSSAPGQNHGVAIYGEAQRGAGSSDAIWALNTVTEAFNLDGATIGYEIDVNNKSGIDPGLNPAQSFHALSLISGAAGRGGTAIVIDRNGDFTGNEWNRGLHVKEVLLRGIEFTNCGNASGFWTDNVLSVKGTSAAFDPLMKFIPYDDTDQSAYIWYAANAADTLVRGGLLKRGELTINEPNGKGAAGLSIKGIADGDDIVFLQRNTDTSPTGTFLRAVNAANTSVFFEIDQNTVVAETNIRLSVAGAAAVRVSVGAADSGGTGFRTLRVPN